MSRVTLVFRSIFYSNKKSGYPYTIYVSNNYRTLLNKSSYFEVRCLYFNKGRVRLIILSDFLSCAALMFFKRGNMNFFVFQYDIPFYLFDFVDIYFFIFINMRFFNRYLYFIYYEY